MSKLTLRYLLDVASERARAMNQRDVPLILFLTADELAQKDEIQAKMKEAK